VELGVVFVGLAAPELHFAGPSMTAAEKECRKKMVLERGPLQTSRNTEPKRERKGGSVFHLQRQLGPLQPRADKEILQRTN